jgi:hypothetical protein
VASARVPILDRVERDEAGTDQSGLGSQGGEYELGLLSRPDQGLLAHRGLGSGDEQRAGRGAEATADGDALGPEDVHERSDRDTEMAADLDKGRMILGDETVCIGSRPEDALRNLVGRASGAVRLDVTVAGAQAVARLATLDDHHMPELGPAVHQPPVRDDAATDARTEGEHQEIARPASRSEAVLAVGGTRPVVLEPHREAEPLLHLVAERDVAERDVHGAERDATLVVDSGGDAKADRRHAFMRQRVHRLDQLGEKRVLRARHGRPRVRLVHPAVGVDQTGQDLGSTEVDPDYALCVHICRVT